LRGALATKAIQTFRAALDCFVVIGAHSRNPLARNKNRA
jgi:hypothetical protein